MHHHDIALEAGFESVYVPLSQVYKQTESEWQIEASDGLAVVAAQKNAIIAALSDAKYDKIIHVRQVLPHTITSILARATVFNKIAVGKHISGAGNTFEETSRMQIGVHKYP